MFDQNKKAEDKEAKKLDKARDEKCIPLAKAYLEIILKHQPSLRGDLDEVKLKAEYEPMMLELLDLYLEKDVTLIEHGYTKKLVLEMIENLDGLLSGSMTQSIRQAERKLWGCEKEDISFKKIDEVLKNAVG